jgi:SAM-dependent methyltransferase
MRRRRKVGRAYDMALEIARILKPGARVLDVGCGTGFIAHHLSGLLNYPVTGLDVGEGTTVPINYLPYDGRHFPVLDQSFDAVLLCYVLHHAQDARLVMEEVRRVLREGGLALVYEDNPGSWWDRMVCWTHNLKWQRRTGPCTFQLESDWRSVFGVSGFTVIKQRALSRWRNIAHPVSRNFFVLETETNRTSTQSAPHIEPLSLPAHREIRAGV